MSRWGKLITFEGLDGSGKSTLLRGVYRELLKYFSEDRIVVTREPGGTPFAEALREVIKREVDREPMSELFALLAARYDHTKRKIIPALRDGKIVLCDRYFDSTFAYQVFGKGLEYYSVSRLNKIASLGIRPELTLMIDVPVDVSLKRIKKNGHYHNLDRSFFERVRYGYLALAKRAKKRIKVLDGTKSEDEVLKEAMSYIKGVVGIS